MYIIKKAAQNIKTEYFKSQKRNKKYRIIKIKLKYKRKTAILLGNIYIALFRLLRRLLWAGVLLE